MQLQNSVNKIAELSIYSVWLKCVIHESHIALLPCEFVCWRQFMAQWVDRKEPRAMAVNIITIHILAMTGDEGVCVTLQVDLCIWWVFQNVFHGEFLDMIKTSCFDHLYFLYIFYSLHIVLVKALFCVLLCIYEELWKTSPIDCQMCIYNAKSFMSVMLSIFFEVVGITIFEHRPYLSRQVYTKSYVLYVHFDYSFISWFALLLTVHECFFALSGKAHTTWQMLG